MSRLASRGPEPGLIPRREAHHFASLTGAARYRDGPFSFGLARMTRTKFNLKERLGVQTASRVRRFRLAEDSRGGQPNRVNREAGVIVGVKICGLESPNGVPGLPQIKGRRYLLEALKAAIPLYEGCAVNANHLLDGDDQVQIEDGFGELRNVRVTELGLFGDLHFLRSHPMAERVCEAAERMPRQFGLSPHHLVDGEPRGEFFVVSKIEEVFSVDLVRTPATTKGLFEEKEAPMDDLLTPEPKPEDNALTMPPEEEKKPEEMMEEEPLTAEAQTLQGALDYLTALKGTYDPSTTKDEVFAAIDTAIMALSEFGAVLEEGEEPPPEEEKKEEEKAMESRRRKAAPTGKVLLENVALRLCLAHGVSKPSPVFLEALIAVGSEAKMKALIEERSRPARPGYTPQRPQSASPRPVTESKNSPLPKNAEEYRNYILN